MAFYKLMLKTLIFSLVALTAWPVVAHADSCWNHNGSLMRLKANGNARAFYYENPRSVLANAGVVRGTLLFDGAKNGNRYDGTARRFSTRCPSVAKPLIPAPAIAILM